MRIIPRPARTLLAVLVGTAVVAACGRVRAASPPSSAPNFEHLATVAGAPITVAAKAARTLQNYAYNTRRFSSDSLWAYRAMDSVVMRVRYAQPSRDSTRMFVQMWGRCVDRERPNCLRDEFILLVAGIQEAEAPPPE